MKPDAPHILLVNPWIHDFAAYDFWAKPLGLLQLASILRLHGYKVSYVDCLARTPAESGPGKIGKRDGRGPYDKTPIDKPKGLEDIQRTYSRYGMRVDAFRQIIGSLPSPDLVLVTSLMTYWYPGVQETIRVLREVLGRTSILLGGIYATLCRDHAERTSGADLVVPGPGEAGVLERVATHTGWARSPLFDPDAMDTYPIPAFDLLSEMTYVPLLTSRGCPFACAYCASRFLQPVRVVRSPESVTAEIEFWHGRHGIRNFAFYDDALLVNADRHIRPILEGVVQKELPARFHTPNAVHVREIDQDLADLMFRAGFETLRLGVETADFDHRKHLDTKVTAAEFAQGIRRLRTAGFREDQIGAYLLVGLPGQSIQSVAESIRIVKQNGVMPVMAYYSPIPHTPMWQSAVASSRYDLESDPIYTNNAIWPCSREPFSWKTVSDLKNLIRA